MSQPTAWRVGHALRLMVAREHILNGTVEVDHFYLGGRPRKHPDDPSPGRGRKGQAKTEKTPVVAIVQRPADVTPGSIAGDARAAVVTGLSLRAAARAIAPQVELQAHLMSDEAKAFMAIGESFATHETVNHSSREYVRDAVHVNSVEGFNARVCRTIAGVFHHISPEEARDRGRKYGTTLPLMYQSVGQLEKHFGREGARSWIEGSAFSSYAAIKSMETAKEVSASCGEMTVEVAGQSKSVGMLGPSGQARATQSLSYQRRPLILPHEITQTMRKDEQIIIIAGHPPLRCGRAIYFRRKDMATQAETNRFAPTGTK